jgi:cation-transporting P-type ATPase I
MASAAVAEPRILSTLPGRLRIQLSGWPAERARATESRLRDLPGIRVVRANPLTGNVLVLFDPNATNEHSVLDAVSGLQHEDEPPAETRAPEQRRPRAIRHERTKTSRKRARTFVRGLERRPHLARKVETRLQHLPGVRAVASELTGRVLIEYDESELPLQDILESLADIELPELEEAAEPAYPLDPSPLIHGIARTTGSAVGIAFLLGRRLVGRTEATSVEQVSAMVADTLTIMRGFPFVRYGMRRLFGEHTADLALSSASAVSLTLAGNVQGLILNGVEGFRLLTEEARRRETWERYAAREEAVADVKPGATIQPEPGDRVPYAAVVKSGLGSTIDQDGNLRRIMPGDVVSPGSPLEGGPFVVQLREGEPFDPQSRRAPVRRSLLDHYLRYVVPFSLGVSAAAGIFMRSISAAFTMLVQTNPRTAMIGAESANLSASARVLRAGVVVVGTRPNRKIRLPHSLIFDGARTLVRGYELGSTVPLTNEFGIEQILDISSSISMVTGSPWGRVFPSGVRTTGENGTFEGSRATAKVGGIPWVLRELSDDDDAHAIRQFLDRGEHVLVLERDDSSRRRVAYLTIRPRLASGARELIEQCRRVGIRPLIVYEGSSNAARGIARRVGSELLENTSAIEALRERQEQGDLVAVVSDNSGSDAAFSECDLAIGVIDHLARFPARADLLAPDLVRVGDIIDAVVRRESTVRDSIVLSIASNLAGLVLFRRIPNPRTAANIIYFTALGSIAAGWLRMRGGPRRASTLAPAREPHPERWARMSVPEVLDAFGSSSHGLTTDQATVQQRPEISGPTRNPLAMAILEQVRSPLIGIMATGAVLALSFGAAADVMIIGATIVTNVAIGVWQEQRADRAALALAEMSAPSCEVLRDDVVVNLPASQLVPGDVILLSPGRRVAADARVIDSDNLEVSEAALTGESLPVFKSVDGTYDQGRIVLEGSDVIAGAGRAVVVATGSETRLGAIAAALGQREEQENPLNARLMRMLNLSLPIAGVAGLAVVVSGFLRTRSLAAPLALGSSVAIAAVPEGLPLLARMGEAAVGQRLAGRRAVVRRLSAIEALGRVDVACVDKTGTMTTGQLEVRILDDLARQYSFPGPLSGRAEAILRTAALASPPPNDANLSAHATDDSVVRAATLAGIGADLEVKRQAEYPFGSERSYHATLVDDRVCLKGAPEVLLPLCARVRRNGEESPLDGDGQQQLLTRAQQLAERGLRVLAVAEGSSDTPLDAPTNLVALGFVGISDPLRLGVPNAVKRCQQAGVRVVMLTGDHPATAKTIAREAGLPSQDEAILTGSELALLENGELDERLERTSIVARATPIDKLRIIESLRRLGHTAAMTGDGVNDAPALRLADVGVAMGRGTEVARQASDIVLLDDDFATLVEALVEGRGFWQNIRRAVCLLLGGNLGELGLISAVSVLGRSAPLNTRQILAVNMITDVLPAVAIALQPPRERTLSRLAREGESSMDAPLRSEIVRRGLATALPSIFSYLAAIRVGAPGEAATVAFSSIVATQFGQTLQAGWADGSLSRPVLGAIAVSTAFLAATLAMPPLRVFLGLSPLSPAGILLVALATVASMAFSRFSTPQRAAELVAAPA